MQGPLQWDFTVGGEIGLHSEQSMGKWEFIAKEQCGVSGRKITNRKHQGSGAWLNWPNRVVAEGRPDCHHLGVVE